MTRLLLKLIICALLAAGGGIIYVALSSGDPVYTLYEGLSPARFHQFDGLIRAISIRHQLDPMLVKAVVWRESRFDPQKFGSAGERGLMQISEKAAHEWARETNVQDFQVEELFDPRKNLEAGCWYLHRAIQHWEAESDPIPFGLAEYNAGASRAQRWAGGDAVVISPETFRDNIDFRSTRKYVDSILGRYEFYKQRGRM